MWTNAKEGERDVKVSDLVMIVKDDCNIKIVDNDEWNCAECTFGDDNDGCRHSDAKIEMGSYDSLFNGRAADVPIKLASKLIKGVWVAKIINTTCLVVCIEE